jgi:hypothetical protein
MRIYPKPREIPQPSRAGRKLLLITTFVSLANDTGSNELAIARFVGLCESTKLAEEQSSAIAVFAYWISSSLCASDDYTHDSLICTSLQPNPTATFGAAKGKVYSSARSKGNCSDTLT